MPAMREVSSEGAALNGGKREGSGVKDRGGVAGRGQVAEVQRARILTAMVQEVSERGAGNVSVGHVVGRCGVSRRTFYELFEDREDCFLAAFDDALKHAAGVVVPAYQQSGSWQAKVRAALMALLECLDYNPAMGRLLVVESLAVGHKALERRKNVLLLINSILDEGRTEGKSGNGPPALTAEGITGGVLSVLHARLTEKHPGGLVELVNPLMGMIVLPYLGPAAARKEIERPTPKRTMTKPTVRADPLQELPMRFTYRTMRVLMSVAEQPGSSNRTISESAGIPDQGQASKLLARLHRLGLIENEGGDPARGEPNAWTLTTTGRDVHDSIAELG
jgi:AcrR family transcriptional regulator/DNA-binding MarR family transcriptional regulator